MKIEGIQALLTRQVFLLIFELRSKTPYNKYTTSKIISPHFVIEPLRKLKQFIFVQSGWALLSAQSLCSRRVACYVVLHKNVGQIFLSTSKKK